MALGVVGILWKQAMVVSLLKGGFNSVLAESVLKPAGGPVALFFLFTWIIGIWLVVSGFRSKTAA